MIYVFTTCALNYFPNAKILAQSVRKQMPEAKIVFCLTDVEPEGFDACQEGFDEYWTLEDLRPQIPNLEQWIFKHNVMELATASKPFVLSALLERDDCDSVLFFDPDCELKSHCAEIKESISNYSITLTPHCSVPHTDDDLIFFELNQLKVGTFNLGFFGVKNDEEGRQFAHWWRCRLQKYCVIDEQRHLFTDQKWIDLVPGYFSSLNVLRGSTYNLARWNTYQRDVQKTDDGTITVDGQPLDFVHISGFLKKGAYVKGLYDTKSAPWCQDIAVLDALSKDYGERLGPDQDRPELSGAWGFDTYGDGAPIPQSHRTAFQKRSGLAKDFENPFAGGDRLRTRIEGKPAVGDTTERPVKQRKFLKRLFGR